MLGFAMFGHDNGTYFLRDRPDARRCKVCGQLLDKWTESLAGTRLRNERFDVSCSYDGVHVVSSRFKEVYDSCGFSGLDFRLLYENFFFISPTEEVAFDTGKRRTRFVGMCAECGLYESVAGATPVFLKSGQTIPRRGFVRTDIEFGSGDEKCPLCLCGTDVGPSLDAAGLTGLDLEPILAAQ